MNSNLEDRVAVLETVYKYAQGLDTRDWLLYRSIFTDEIDVDFSGYNGVPGERMSADRWIAQIKPLFTGISATQHIMTNPIVEFSEKGAVCRMYIQAEHFLASGEGFAIGGYYTDRLVRQKGQWRISAIKLTVFWRRGNADIMNKAIENFAALMAAKK